MSIGTSDGNYHEDEWDHAMSLLTNPKTAQPAAQPLDDLFNDLSQAPQSPQERANVDLKMNMQEQNLYQMHLDNLSSPGGVDNPDGSRSTLFVSTHEIEGKHYVIPNVWDGKILPGDQSRARAEQQGLENFPSYPSQAEAFKRYMDMHKYMEEDTQDYLQNKTKPQPDASQSLREGRTDGLTQVADTTTTQDNRKYKNGAQVRDDMEYSVLEEKLGKEGAEIIKSMDGLMDGGAYKKAWDDETRQRWIDIQMREKNKDQYPKSKGPMRLEIGDSGEPLTKLAGDVIPFKHSAPTYGANTDWDKVSANNLRAATKSTLGRALGMENVRPMGGPKDIGKAIKDATGKSEGSPLFE